MSNLYKRQSIVSKDERIIDYNDIIKDKLSAYMQDNSQRMDPDGFVAGLNADVVDTLLMDEDPEMMGDAAVTEEQLGAMLEQANAQAEDIINSANDEANNVIMQANDEAEQIRMEARESGYNDGIMSAQAEIDNMKQQLEQQYADMRVNLENEYEQRKAELEPELIDVLAEVFRRVTLTVAEDNYEILLHLINGVMRNAENSREFLIKVCPDDYTFLVNNQGKIYCAMSKEIQLDIVEDATMSRNECLIETDGGIFNCSLDIELNNLIKDLKLLSCM